VLVQRSVVYAHPKITVWHYPTPGVIHHQVHAPCADQIFREALTAGTDAMMLRHADRWLSDDRANGPLTADDEDWATKVWFPRTQLAGWRYWAMVMPTQVLGQLDVMHYVELYRAQGIVTKVFDQPDEAFAWICLPTPT
jgi:hypothetical protein